jgi:hypothetical protein
MNSGQHVDQDVSEDTTDAATDEAAEEVDQAEEGDPAEAVDSDDGPLERSQDAIDQGREAARDALKDTLPDDEERNVSQSEQKSEGD